MTTTETKPKTTARSTAKPNVPLIYGKLSAILADLHVEANGDLPDNMGGKPYIPAKELAAKLKAQFIEKGVINLPDEHFVQHLVIPGEGRNAGRNYIFISVEGAYTLVAVEDGSTVTIKGAGDGTAIGTSVATNIASTNAFKNAFLRLFDVTESSVEDEATYGARGPAVPAAVARAAADPTEVSEPDTVPDTPNVFAQQKKFLMERAKNEFGQIKTWADEALKDEFAADPSLRATFVTNPELVGKVAVYVRDNGLTA